MALPPIAFSFDVFAEQVYGGVSRYFAELHRGLLARGHGSWIVAGLYVNEYIAGMPHVIGVKVPTWKPGRVRVLGASAATAILEQVWLMRGGPRPIYHKTYYGPRHPPRGVPVVVTVYDMIHELFPASFSASDPTPRRKAWWCERADLIIAISEQTKHDVVRLLGVDPGKVVVTPLAHSTVEPTAGAAPPRPYLLYVGDRRGYKNFGRTVRAFARDPALAGVDLVCFGGGALAAAERELLTELRVRDRVTQTSGGDGDLARWYRDAIALVYPSEYEGFGLPPLEAMAHDCPVVCSTGGSIPEVVGDAGLLFDPTDTDELAVALGTIVHDSEARAGLIARGRARRAQFSWSRTVDLTVSAYQRL